MLELTDVLRTHVAHHNCFYQTFTYAETNKYDYYFSWKTRRSNLCDSIRGRGSISQANWRKMRELEFSFYAQRRSIKISIVEISSEIKLSLIRELAWNIFLQIVFLTIIDGNFFTNFRFRRIVALWFAVVVKSAISRIFNFFLKF